jgi:hypothetical protein
VAPVDAPLMRHAIGGGSRQISSPVKYIIETEMALMCHLGILCDETSVLPA